MNEALNTVKALVNEASFDCTPVVINKQDYIFVPMAKPAHWPSLVNGIQGHTADKITHNFIQVDNNNYLVFSVKPSSHATTEGQSVAAVLDGEHWVYTHQKIGPDDTRQDFFMVPSRQDILGYMQQYITEKLQGYNVTVGGTVIAGCAGVFLTITTKLTTNETA